jgi:hypothetical protein
MNLGPRRCSGSLSPRSQYDIINDAQQEDDPDPQTDGVMSLGLVRFLLQASIDISTALGVDAAERAVWQDRLTNLGSSRIAVARVLLFELEQPPPEPLGLRPDRLERHGLIALPLPREVAFLR